MKLLRRSWITGVLVMAMVVAGCSQLPGTPDAAERTALAPTGTLRVGVYPGSPTSMVTDKAGNTVGISYELGQELAQRLGVPFEAKEYRRIAEVIEAMQAGQVDFTFTNATVARQKILDFTPILLRLELGYLVPKGSRLEAATDVDRAGVRVAVMKGGTTASVLGSMYRQAKIVEVSSPKEAAQFLQDGKADAFTTNKGILFELADQIPGAKVLPGRWGLERMAAGVPKGRDAGLNFLQEFGKDIQTDGTLKKVIERAGIRGFVDSE